MYALMERFSYTHYTPDGLSSKDGPFWSCNLVIEMPYITNIYEKGKLLSEKRVKHKSIHTSGLGAKHN